MDGNQVIPYAKSIPDYISGGWHRVPRGGIMRARTKPRIGGVKADRGESAGIASLPRRGDRCPDVRGMRGMMTRNELPTSARTARTSGCSNHVHVNVDRRFRPMPLTFHRTILWAGLRPCSGLLPVNSNKCVWNRPIICRSCLDALGKIPTGAKLSDMGVSAGRVRPIERAVK